MPEVVQFYPQTKNTGERFEIPCIPEKDLVMVNPKAISMSLTYLIDVVEMMEGNLMIIEQRRGSDKPKALAFKGDTCTCIVMPFM
jgi:hypothetical protein